MTKVMRMAYTEVDEILKYMPKEYIEKIPMKLKRLFSECKLANYEVKINPNKSLSEQKIIYETLVILTILRYNYWCDTEEEKRKLEEQMKENDQKALKKYDVSILNKNEFFENIDGKVECNDNLPAKVETRSWFSKILLKIKTIFKK